MWTPPYSTWEDMLPGMCLNNFVTSVALAEVCTVLSAILVCLEFILRDTKLWFSCSVDSFHCSVNLHIVKC